MISKAHGIEGVKNPRETARVEPNGRPGWHSRPIKETRHIYTVQNSDDVAHSWSRHENCGRWNSVQSKSRVATRDTCEFRDHLAFRIDGTEVSSHSSIREGSVFLPSVDPPSQFEIHGMIFKKGKGQGDTSPRREKNRVERFYSEICCVCISIRAFIVVAFYSKLFDKTPL